MTLQEGLQFADRYKLIKQLGRGGFSEVWLAEDSLTSVQVAIKVYAPGTGLDDEGIKMFTQEFSMVFDMNHTNLLRPTHYDYFDRMPYLIMPLIKNGSAFKYIARGENMPEDECWKMLHDVAAGLAYLHEKNPPLIHQDIKPDNILIDDEGRYLITDFGISARVRSTIRKGQAQEQSGGTFAYMGPERFGPKPKPIMASDIWSLGAMMFELMTGLPPFGNHGGLLQMNGAMIPIIEEEYAEDLKQIIYNCLAKEPWDRPSAKKIEEMTYNKLHGLPMQAEAPATAPAETPSETPVEAPQEPAAATAQPAAPVQPTAPAQPVAKKSLPLNDKGGNKKMIFGGIAAAVVLIGILVAVFSGGSDEPEQVVPEVVQPAIDYEAEAKAKFDESTALIMQADTFLANHPDDKFDEKYNKVEDIYANALKKLDDALQNKDSISTQTTAAIMEKQTTIKQSLLGIYKELSETANALKEVSVDAALEFEKRAGSIKPYIDNLIEN